MNDELLKVQKWLAANKLTLNIKKSNFIIFHRSRHKLANQMSIKIWIIHPTKIFRLNANNLSSILVY